MTDQKLRVFVNERRWANASDAGMQNPDYQIPVSLRERLVKVKRPAAVAFANLDQPFSQ